MGYRETEAPALFGMGSEPTHVHLRLPGASGQVGGSQSVYGDGPRLGAVSKVEMASFTLSFGFGSDAVLGTRGCWGPA